MKIAVIGGGGVRAPLLLHGLIREHAGLPVSEIALYDPAAEKLALLEPVWRAMLDRAGHPFRVSRAASLDEAAEGAAFLITSIRAGGMAARATDERLLLDRNLLGQETVGAAGFAKALRTIPPMIEIARAAARRAPAAWIVNFTNPVGIISEAVRQATGARIIGICDTPLELYEGLAAALGRPLSALHFEYFGLNHLGWVKAVLDGGVDRLPEILRDPQRLAAVYRHQLFEPELIANLGALPSEYLYYYYHPDQAISNFRRSGQSRGESIAAMNVQLWESLARADRPLETYEQYLAHRDGTYMSLETGAARTSPPDLWERAAGYDRIALAVMTAIHRDTHAVLPVDVENLGAVEGLEDTDVVEAPCVLGRHGALPLATGRPPASVSNLLAEVKQYERLTVRAALDGSAARATEARAVNPLVRSRPLALELVTEFRARHPQLLGYLH